MKLVARIFHTVSVSLAACMAALLAVLWRRLPDAVPLLFGADGSVAAVVGRIALAALPAAGAAVSCGLLLSARIRAGGPERRERRAALLAVASAHIVLMILVVFLYIAGGARAGAPMPGFPAALGICALMLLVMEGLLIRYGRLGGR